MRKLVIGENDLVSLYPEVAQQWDTDRNSRDITTIHATSNKKAYWMCHLGHTWEAVISSRTRGGKGCPYCSGYRTWIGFNDLSSTHPDLVDEWDQEKNSISPHQVSHGTTKKVYWICDEGHSYLMSPASRTRKDAPRGCNICSGKVIVPGVNDLASAYPELVSEWSEDNDLLPIEITPYSLKIIKWVCQEGHHWKNSAYNRTRKGDRCPYCYGRKAVPGVTDAGTLFPHLISEYSEKNSDDIHSLRPHSHVRSVWKCNDCSGEWTATIASRVNGSGCPYCSGKKVLVGFNDLATTHPELALQFSGENELTPQEVSRGSEKRIIWECMKSHEWEATVSSRVTGNGCPKCAASISSAMEREVADYIREILPDNTVVTNTKSVIPPLEIDIYIPEKNIAVEFNGLYWHSEKFVDKNYHYNKWKKCKDQGIQLITVWEDEWRNSQEVVKSMLSHKLGTDSSPRVYARSTTVTELTLEIVVDFLGRHHIQGHAQGSYYVGLKNSNGDLVAVSVWRKNKDILYLDRYATSSTVIGGMGKLLKAGIRYAKNIGCSQVVTFADHCVSDGGLYEKLGFRLDSELKPDYRYVVSNERKHKFGYRLKRFRNDPDLQYRDNMTERELAELNGIERIWDCGKSRYVIDVT